MNFHWFGFGTPRYTANMAGHGARSVETGQLHFLQGAVGRKGRTKLEMIDDDDDDSSKL